MIIFIRSLNVVLYIVLHLCNFFLCVLKTKRVLYSSSAAASLSLFFVLISYRISELLLSSISIFIIL